MFSHVKRVHLKLASFSLGCLGWLLSFITLNHTEWRLWLVKSSPVFSSGITYIGMWKICFPPNLKAPDNYTIVCCHKFSFNETSFPLEMLLAQILLLIAGFSGGLAIFFTFLPSWQLYLGPRNKTWIKFLHLAGGILYVFAGICVLVPVTWNGYSVATHNTIPFPSSFHLPPVPMAQQMGTAIPIGFMSGVLLLISGIFIFLIRYSVTLIRVNPVNPRSM